METSQRVKAVTPVLGSDMAVMAQYHSLLFVIQIVERVELIDKMPRSGGEDETTAPIDDVVGK